jgi:putative FmdB family regulatory protein
MPTYTYRCQKCGEEFERFQSMSDAPVKRCPTCKGKVQRTFHPVGIVLKGSGFHKTDYRSPSRQKGESEAKSEAKGESDTKGETKSESKSESKTETKKESKGSEKKTSSGSSSD